MTRLARLFSPRLLAVALALGLSVTVLPATPASAAVQKVKGRFFGMTDNDPLSWPKAPIGALRLWDAGVSWREIERVKGSFDFSRLDALVAEARSHNARPLLVLGQTPQFYALSPNASSYYGPGASSMPNLKAYRTYVRTVTRRYGAKMDYQVWNEANVPGFWSGSPAQMAKLTKITSKIVSKEAGKKAKVVGPALATRLTGQRRWLRDFFAQRTGRRPVGAWMDIVSLNLYPGPKEGPEDSMSLLAASRSMLRDAGVNKPIWNTEINYGLRTGGGGKARNISRAKEASFVTRTYVLNSANNVKRVFWYSWDIGGLANTQLSYGAGSLTRAGRAYIQMREWMLGAKMQGCDRSGKLYTCKLTYSGGVKRIYWRTSGATTISTDGTATRVYDLRASSEKIKGGSKLRITQVPVMVRSRR